MSIYHCGTLKENQDKPLIEIRTDCNFIYEADHLSDFRATKLYWSFSSEVVMAGFSFFAGAGDG